MTDFGLAKKLDDAVGPTLSGQVMGTPEYLAPEQASGKGGASGPAADIYALGAILYECLTGRPPFRAASVLETLAQVLGDEPVAPRSLNAAVPLELESICLKCLEKEPARRYRGAGALGEDLEHWLLAGKPIRARPVRLAERAVKWAKRNPAVSALSAAVLLTFALGAGAATWFGLDATFQAGEAKKAVGREREKADEAEKLAKKADRAAETASKSSEEARESEKKALKNEAAAKEEAYRANLALHAIKITSALQAWRRHDVARAETILGEVREEFRQTWEYRHVLSLCRRKALTLKGHTDTVRAVAFSPDGSRVVSGSGGSTTLKVWDAATGRELLTLNGHTNEVNAVAYSPCGGRIASASADNSVRVWDAWTGKDLITIQGNTGSVYGFGVQPRWFVHRLGWQ